MADSEGTRIDAENPIDADQTPMILIRVHLLYPRSSACCLGDEGRGDDKAKGMASSWTLSTLSNG